MPWRSDLALDRTSCTSNIEDFAAERRRPVDSKRSARYYSTSNYSNWVLELAGRFSARLVFATVEVFLLELPKSVQRPI